MSDLTSVEPCPGARDRPRRSVALWIRNHDLPLLNIYQISPHRLLAPATNATTSRATRSARPRPVSIIGPTTSPGWYTLETSGSGR